MSCPSITAIDQRAIGVCLKSTRAKATRTLRTESSATASRTGNAQWESPARTGLALLRAMKGSAAQTRPLGSLRVPAATTLNGTVSTSVSPWNSVLVSIEKPG